MPISITDHAKRKQRRDQNWPEQRVGNGKEEFFDLQSDLRF